MLSTQKLDLLPIKYMYILCNKNLQMYRHNAHKKQTLVYK